MNRRRVAALAVAAILATACGVQPDAAPREVPEDQRPALVVAVGGVSQGASRIYLVGPGDDRLLRSVKREAGPAESLMDELLRGPNQEEGEAGFGSAIPATLVMSTSRRGSRLELDVTPELLELSGTGLVQALAQIVYTANEIDGVQSVRIEVDGRPQAWPTADLDTTTEPLRVYDYPGMVRSAQPAYPSWPSSD